MPKSSKKSSNIPEGIPTLPKVEIFIQEPSSAPKKIETPDMQDKRDSGVHFDYVFSKPDIHPYLELEWTKRRSVISDEKGNIIAEQKDVEVPTDWSQLATDILSTKYFRKAGLPGGKGESSAKQVVDRIVKAIRGHGEQVGKYFATDLDADAFERDLTWLLINQAVAFNSPVWFNCGLYQAYGIEGSNDLLRYNPKTGVVEELPNAYEHPQCSACFIQSIDDNLMSIFDLVKNEAKLFKYGSGTGTNFSNLRSYHETLSGGGTSSGLMSFLQVFDRGAGATKSGGVTRRAAKMVILNVDHPEIFDFASWKAKEEEKARILIEFGGYPSDFNGEAYHTVSGQNSNNSVRVTDDFMRAVENDEDWQTTARTTGKPVEKFKTRKLMDTINHSAWLCADPGLQFDTAINLWHTCKASGRINASNPCSEYMFLDDSACNLASINLVKFIGDDDTFNIERYRQAIKIFTTAMEIIVDFSSYPTEKIAYNSAKYRPLGLGYANLGTLLMLWGIPYDSKEGEVVAGALTAILTGHSYKTSAEIAKSTGPFDEFQKNRESFMEVMNMHRSASYDISDKNGHPDLISAARQDWNEAVRLGEQFGYRNAQATVIAPTGTIGLLMDCDTTGIEPAFSLISFKKLAGGGSIKIVNQSVPRALKALNYSEKDVKEIVNYIIGNGSFDGSVINRESLKAKGLTDVEIDRLEPALIGAFDLSFAFNKATIEQSTYERLGITEEERNQSGFNFLSRIGFTNEEIMKANKEICGHMMIEGAPHLKEEHLKVFDCANTNGSEGKRYIEPMGHVRMMAAVQPFISGAISKTVNMPNSSTEAEIAEIHTQAWKMGLKAIAIYRDGSKHSQPLSSKTDSKDDDGGVQIVEKIVYKSQRKKLPDERRSITHKFSIGTHEGYITVGLYDNGQPGEIFITMAKQGSVISGLMNSFATSISISLQYGVPVKVLVNKFIHVRFEPSGFTTNPNIQMAKSIVDYIFRWLAMKFLSPTDLQVIGLNGEVSANQISLNLNTPVKKADEDVIELANEDLTTIDPTTANEAINNIEDQKSSTVETNSAFFDTFSDAPACEACGGIMTRSGTCYKCMNCGGTSGCS